MLTRIEYKTYILLGSDLESTSLSARFLKKKMKSKYNIEPTLNFHISMIGQKLHPTPYITHKKKNGVNMV